MGAKHVLCAASVAILLLTACVLQGCKKPIQPDVGALQVTIKPATIAYELGGKWALDGGDLQNSGATIAGILTGTHTVTFSPVTHWESPLQQNVLITKDQTLSIEVTYYKQYTLTVAVLGNGMVTPAPGAHVYREGQLVTLAATSQAGWIFDHWEGDLGSEEPTEAITMNADKAVTAVFTQLPRYTLVINVEGTGTTIPAEGAHEYASGEMVTIVATPAAGWHFDHWTGALSGDSFTGNVTMDGNQQVTAFFVRDEITYTLGTSAVPGIGGSVALLPAGGEYLAGTLVVATATPTQYYRFTGWSGDISGDTNPVGIEMTEDKDIIANFVYEPPYYTIDAWGQPNAGGAVTLNPEPSENGYLVGASVTVTAVPFQNYRFIGWLGDETGNQNPLSVIMDSDKTFVARYEYNPSLVNVSVSAAPVDGGTVVLSPPDGAYIPGTEISVAAIPKDNYRFDGWEGDISSTNNPITFTVSANMSIQARFVERELVLGIGVEPAYGGYVTADPPGGSYLLNTLVNLLATAHKGYFFMEWQGDVNGTDESVDVIMDSNKQVTAVFNWEVKFPDANLDAAVREALGFKGTDPYYASDLDALTRLTASGRNIESIEGLQNCRNLRQVNVSNNKIRNLWPLVNNPNFGSGCSLNITSNALTWTSCDPLERLEARGVVVVAPDICSAMEFVSLADYWPLDKGNSWPKALFGCGANLLNPSGDPSASSKTVTDQFEINGIPVWKVEYRIATATGSQEAFEYYTVTNGGLYLTKIQSDFAYLPEVTIKPILPEMIAIGQPCNQCDATFGLLTVQRGKLSDFRADLSGFDHGDVSDVIACSFGGAEPSLIFGRCLGPIFSCVLADPLNIVGTCK